MSNLNAFGDVLLDSSAKSAVILAIALIASISLRRASAAARHLLWTLAVTVAALLPLVHLAPARREVAVLPSLPPPAVAVEYEAPLPVVQPTIQIQPQATNFAPPIAAEITPAPVVVAPPPRRFNWIFNVMDIWAAGASIVALFWTIGIVGVWRTLLRSHPLDEGPLLDAAKRLQFELRIRRNVRVRIGDRATMPMTWGLLRPCVILPADAEEWPAERLRVVLLHELAHVARMDCATQWPAQVACVIYWFNPLAWLAARSQRAERERACDDAVLNHGLTPPAYADHLLAVARSLARSGIAGTAAVAMARRSGLRRRVTAILDATTNRTALTRRFFLIAAAAVFLVLAPSCAVHVALHAPADQQASNGMLDLLVLDQTSGKPIAGEIVQVAERNGWRSLSTAADGHVAIPVAQNSNLPDRPLSLRLKPPGYVQTYLDWRARNLQDDNPVPSKYTVKLERGTRVSGRVIDDNGQPIAGAHVQIQLARKQSSDERVVNPWVPGEAVSASDGRWTFDQAPAEIESAKVAAWDYRHETDGKIKLITTAPQSLLEGSATISLAQGVPLTGVVMGKGGLPVAGASVGLGENSGSFDDVPPLKTGADGRFAYQVKPDSTAVLTVQAPGYSPDLKKLDIARDKTEVNFNLSPGNRLHGKVIDDEGQPVANAKIWTSYWRGFTTLSLEMRTDAAGQFNCDDAPADIVTAVVQTEHFGTSSVHLTPSDDETVIKMRWPHIVRGTVVDAADGKPISPFRFIIESSFGDGQPPVQYVSESLTTAAAAFGAGLNLESPFGMVRIEADGYYPAESAPFPSNIHEVTLPFKLVKGEGMHIKILAPKGSPAAGAIGLMRYAGSPLRLQGGNPSDMDKPRELIADAYGEMQLLPMNGPFELAVVAREGFAEANQDELASSKQLKLTAWSHIQGVLVLDGKPAPNEMVSIEMLSQPGGLHTIHELQTTTGSDGRFTFDRVPPGKLQVGRRVQFIVDDVQAFPQSPRKQLEIAAGDTINVQLGGVGRTALGKVILPPELASNWNWSWNFSSCSAYIDAPLPPTMMPFDWRTASVEERQRRTFYIYWSEAGRAYTAKLRTALEARDEHPLQMRDDGAFRVPDLLPGDYVFQVSAVQNRDENNPANGTPLLASGQLKFTVPAGPVDQPVELPAMKMEKVAPASQPQP